MASCAVLYRRDCGGEIKQNMPWATYATALYGKEWGMQTGGGGGDPGRGKWTPSELWSKVAEHGRKH